MGNGGEDWKTIAVSQWWLNLEDSARRQVLVSQYGIFEILTGAGGGGPRRRGPKAATTRRNDWKHRDLRCDQRRGASHRMGSRKEIIG